MRKPSISRREFLRLSTVGAVAALAACSTGDMVMMAAMGDAIGPIYQPAMDYLTKLLSYNPIALYPLNEASGTVADNAQGNAALDGAYSTNRSGWTITTGPFGEAGAGLFAGEIANIYSAALAAALTPDEQSILLWVKPSGVSVWTDATTRYIWEMRADSDNFRDIQVSGVSGSLFWRRRGGGVTSDLNNSANAWTDWNLLGSTTSKAANQFFPYQNGGKVPDIISPSIVGTWAGSLASTQAIIGALNSSKATPSSHYLMYAMLFNTALTQIQMADLATKYIVLPARTHWTQVLFDDFDSVLDASKWTAADETTGELSYYRPGNVDVTGGNLVLTAKSEIFGGKSYTSGKITSMGKVSWTYGAFEARIKLVGGKGIHPSMWMLPVSTTKYGAWPASGELDILELAGNHPTQTMCGIHFGSFSGSYNAANTAADIYEAGVDLTAAYHVYRCEWTPFAFYWYLDGVLTSIQTRWTVAGYSQPSPYDMPFYLMFTLTVTNTNGGPPDGTVTFPLSMLVDWVKVYQ